MKDLKLYDLIFPIWLMIFFPPMIFITLIGNFIIDSIVLIGCYSFFRLKNEDIRFPTFYKKNIFKVWFLGLMADIIGAALLIVISFAGPSLGISDKVLNAINYAPFGSLAGVLIIIFSTMVSGFFLYLFNKQIFKNQFSEGTLKVKIAVAIAVITMPYTFLLPTHWFYH